MLLDKMAIHDVTNIATKLIQLDCIAVNDFRELYEVIYEIIKSHDSNQEVRLTRYACAELVRRYGYNHYLGKGNPLNDEKSQESK